MGRDEVKGDCREGQIMEQEKDQKMAERVGGVDTDKRVHRETKTETETD